MAFDSKCPHGAAIAAGELERKRGEEDARLGELIQVREALDDGDTTTEQDFVDTRDLREIVTSAIEGGSTPRIFTRWLTHQAASSSLMRGRPSR